MGVSFWKEIRTKDKPMMIYRLFLCVIFLMPVSCTSTPKKDYPKPAISSEQFDVAYQKSCELAASGSLDAMREVLMATGDFDGESAFTHGMNLVALRHLQNGVFAEALGSLPPLKAETVESSVRNAERTLELLHQQG